MNHTIQWLLRIYLDNIKNNKTSYFRGKNKTKTPISGVLCRISYFEGRKDFVACLTLRSLPDSQLCFCLTSRALGISVNQYVAFYRTFCLSTNPPHKDGGLITTPFKQKLENTNSRYSAIILSNSSPRHQL